MWRRYKLSVEAFVRNSGSLFIILRFMCYYHRAATHNPSDIIPAHYDQRMKYSKHKCSSEIVSWGKQGEADSCRVKVVSFHLSSYCLSVNCIQLGDPPMSSTSGSNRTCSHTNTLKHTHTHTHTHKHTHRISASVPAPHPQSSQRWSQNRPKLPKMLPLFLLLLLYFWKHVELLS